MAYFLQHPDSDDDDAELDFLADVMNGYGGAVDFLHDVDMENLYFGNGDDDDFFDPDYDDQLDFLDHDFSDDSDYSDAEDHNKIFISLQDSVVLRRLNFHKALGNGKFRLPKITKAQQETYESLYKVLDELDIMLKVWKKRTEHVFTAHIQKGDEEKAAEDASGDDSSMRFGVDYSDSDIAHESDDGEAECRNRIGVWGNGNGEAEGASASKSSNESLTKKKYCQSTRLFYSVFDGASPDKKFEALSSFVRKAKRHVHSTIYSLFISALPEDVGTKMPREIWEKVWRFTQTPYDELHTYNAGFRFAEGGVQRDMEKHRVAELFGAVGNLHMTVFEILFKHAYITRMPTLLGLESGLESFKEATRKKRPASYAKTRFQRFRRLFERAFAQLLELQQHNQHMQQEGEEEGEEMSRVQKIDAGQFTCRKRHIADFKDCNVLDKQPDPVSTTFYHGDKTGMVIAPSSPAGGEAEVVAVVQYDVDSVGTAMLAFDIWNARLGRTVARIEPGIPFVDILGSGLVFAQSGELTGDRLAFLLQTDDGNMPYRTYLYVWKFDPASESGNVLNKPEAKIDCKMDIYAMGTVKCLTMKFVELGAERAPACAVCMEGQSAVKNAASVGNLEEESEGDEHIFFEIRFFDPESQSELRERRIKVPKQSVVLECAKKNLLIARYGDGGMTRKGLLAIDVNNGEVVGDYPMAALCKDAEHGHSDSYECVYEAKFDEAPQEDKFLIFSQNLTNFQLFDFSEQGVPPKVVNSGSSVVYELNWRRLNRTTLYDGVLYCGPKCDISVRAHCGDYFEDNSDARCVDLFAFDLKDCSVHPIVNLIESHNDSRPRTIYHVNDTDIDLDSRRLVDENDRVLTNEHSRSIYADALYSGPPCFISPSSLILPMHRSYVEVTLQPNSESAFNAEAEDISEQQEIKAELLKRKAEAEERKQKKISEDAEKQKKKREEEIAAKAAIADSGEALKGRVKKWEYSYGFIEISEPKEHRKAGGIFAHISDFKNRGKKRIRKGQKVEFRVVSQEGGKYRAVEINLV